MDLFSHCFLRIFSCNLGALDELPEEWRYRLTELKELARHRVDKAQMRPLERYSPELLLRRAIAPVPCYRQAELCELST